jgi:hypothetical protein
MSAEKLLGKPEGGPILCAAMPGHDEKDTHREIE